MSMREEMLEKYGETLYPKSETIRGPGKFEAEPWYTLYFYDRVMEGGGDETLDFGGEVSADIFVLDAEDKRNVPELADTYAVALWESDQGFVNLEEFEDEEDLEAYREKAAEAGEEYEGEGED